MRRTDKEIADRRQIDDIIRMGQHQFVTLRTQVSK